MISLRTHNILDYVFGAVLILCPYIFGFSDVVSARSTFAILGVGIVCYSLLTKYRYSFLKIIPLGIHMVLDAVLGFALMVAPWVVGYRDLITNGQTVLHVVLGLGAWGLVASTNRRTGGYIRAVDEETPISRRVA